MGPEAPPPRPQIQSHTISLTSGFGPSSVVVVAVAAAVAVAAGLQHINDTHRTYDALFWEDIPPAQTQIPSL